ncbi:hypothetical protein CS063_10825 [Sporanaerobium hydrogeniformans]|uniref:Uncharacterized protein n=1 Tax=Sporanaerobium hydrogeniformans TaxID=3072179 RepID=A0AC61DAX3_9FIRM|nr:spore cortex biosynthesis protein YabQ [Sporanaerobium hydrogeniformans]PHV70365.1 hypothetical protein CS063_10825 [Sporanaerobium hydrogeniformans]
MNPIVSSQTLLFITCIEIGILMGTLFDLVRIFRKLIKHPNFLVQMEDAIYWVGCAFISFYLLYITNYAAIRPFAFIGMLLGGIFYFSTFSIIFMKIATAVIDYMKKLMTEMIRLLLIPVQAFIRWLKGPVGYVNKKVENIHNYQRRKVRKLKRQWYHKKADIKTDKKVRKQMRKAKVEKKLLER